MAPTLYYDGHVAYLELHAMRAPVGHYKPEITPDEYDHLVQQAIQDFQDENRIEIYQLGRSGRHMCIDDTPTNRRRYASLQRKAIAAARAMWADMRTLDNAELESGAAQRGSVSKPSRN